MTSFKIGDVVELRNQRGWRGKVLDVVEGRPCWLLIHWGRPPNIVMNPRLESEDVLALTARG